MLKVTKCLPIVMMVASHALLAEPLSKEAGWGVTLSVNVGYSGGTSQFDTDDDNQITDNLTNSGQFSGSSLTYPLGTVLYTLDNLNTQFFLGNSRDQVAIAQFQYELGLRHQFSDDSKLTFAFFPKLSFFNETWSDPFVEASNRDTTDVSVGGARIAVERILGSPFTFKYAVASSSIDDEESGQSQLMDEQEIAALQRDSLYQKFEVETLLPIDSGLLLKPSLQYTHRNAEGDANSFNQYVAQVAVMLFRDRHTLITTLGVGKRFHQQENPIFDTTQKVDTVSIFSVYSYQRPFNWKSWDWTVMLGYSREDANIEFYDNDSFIVSTGMVYQF
ncbi:DUF2860 domain-containing protein [Psychromonas sp. B3M02]|uniref:DUF2860 family protein n=1 Tax=Psychromonas sp. B3M02 TaxID=2267226 RepID=UPI000DEB80ED|nr:DUF2860 family protein [Psychromonas sp. B3M02]RBW46498.1 DUF2860 domain-containing protein [Psychromonas sp. B3M02]